MNILKPGDPAPEAKVYRCSGCGSLSALLDGEAAAECHKCILNKKKQVWHETNHAILIQSKNVAEEMKKLSTFSDKIADLITTFCGSMWFVYLHIAWFIMWILYNTLSPNAFDPFPFGLLTMIVSLEAIMLATFIMISQNRQSMVADVRSELDFQVNVKSERMIAELKAMVSELHNELSRKKK